MDLPVIGVVPGHVKRHGSTTPCMFKLTSLTVSGELHAGDDGSAGYREGAQLERD